ncbi:hypothetical protein BD311DRAFT_749470 [Dichomitus squalens]|uniref:Uncharacterized protein n=1 Tax=Dichomitus squalens TaxID=114155 RepID=A0A4V2K1L5_9APHY|nr:hypothetical protein BD311DRAFT_749470 [Dichomitus squalens]
MSHTLFPPSLSLSQFVRIVASLSPTFHASIHIPSPSPLPTVIPHSTTRCIIHLASWNPSLYSLYRQLRSF